MAKRAFINPANVRRIGAFSHAAATQGGVTVHVSGQIALDKDGSLVGKGDLRAQTQQVFENIRIILEEAGGSFNDVVKLTHYVVGLKPENRALITEVRNKYVNQANPPASTMIGIDALVMDGLLIEVEALAVIDEARARLA
ncbi:MAG TPA: RidA family protein [Burkholderiales bacterium]|jgi:enamine deaminase RidA (YjgF/YER057c/UK114 family)|nr:RidA family protein [Burkholderiales bacterium]